MVTIGVGLNERQIRALNLILVTNRDKFNSTEDVIIDAVNEYLKKP